VGVSVDSVWLEGPIAQALTPELKVKMEIATRPCRPGDEKALSIVAQGTILETYAGITDGHDLVTYAAA